MQDKLSIKKVYFNAVLYTVRHLKAFLFLALLYFFGNLLPMFIGIKSLRLIAIPYFFLFLFVFLYFAAGCYYKEKLLFDRKIFCAAGLRFLTAFLSFVAVLTISTVIINQLLLAIQNALIMGGYANEGETTVYNLLRSNYGLIVEYLFIFATFVIFFIIPSFAFLSEISGKSRSFLAAYAKTKGNFIRIAAVCALAYFLLYAVIEVCILLKINLFLVELFRDFVLVFIMITYFKMYDFFYKIPKNKQAKEIKTDMLDKEETVKTARKEKAVKNTEKTDIV